MKTDFLSKLIIILAVSSIFASCEKAPTSTTTSNPSPTNKNSVVATTSPANKNMSVTNLPQNTVTPVNSQPTINSQPTATPIPQNKRLGIMPNNSSTPSAETLVTIEKFETLKIGMDYKETASILGSKGITQGGFKTSVGAMQLYSWKGKSENGDWIITARFDKGKLVNKVQFGLK